MNFFDFLSSLWTDEGWAGKVIAILMPLFFAVLFFLIGSITGSASSQFRTENLRATTVYLETEDAGTIKCYRDPSAAWLVNCQQVAR